MTRNTSCTLLKLVVCALTVLWFSVSANAQDSSRTIYHKGVPYKAGGSTPSPAIQRAFKKGAVIAGRRAIGPVIVGVTGKIVKGGPLGAAVGVFFSPTRLGDGTLHGSGGAGGNSHKYQHVK